jgi:hypothetical protein
VEDPPLCATFVADCALSQPTELDGEVHPGVIGAGVRAGVMVRPNGKEEEAAEVERSLGY